MACAAGIIVLVFAIVWEIARQAVPAMAAQGLGFLSRGVWNASTNEFGILPEIWGTLYSSLLALLIGGFFGVTVAIFLTQDFLPARLAAVFRTIVEMLAAIPSRGLRPVGHLRGDPADPPGAPTGCTRRWASSRSSAPRSAVPACFRRPWCSRS